MPLGPVEGSDATTGPLLDKGMANVTASGKVRSARSVTCPKPSR
jgi:hypothetical protein